MAAAGAVALLAFRWRELGFEWQEFAGTFREVRWLWIAAGAAFALATYLGRALRWQVLIRGVKPRSSFRNLTIATAIGFTAIVVFGRPGEVIRPYLISLKEKVPFPSQVAAWLLERIYDLLTALLLFGFALARVQSSGAEVGPQLEWVLRIGGWAAGGVAAVCLGVLVVFGRYGEKMENRLLDAVRFLPDSKFTRVEQIVKAFRQGMDTTSQPNIVYLLSAYSLFEWLLIFGCNVCVLWAFPVTAHFGLTDVAIFLGFVVFGAVVQIPGVGGGVQVVSVVVLTELFGLRLEAASGIAVLTWAVTFLVIVPIGVLLAFHEGLNWRRIKEIEDEVHL